MSQQDKIVTLRTGEDIANEAVQRIQMLQTGQIQPITTGISHFDEALLGGLLPGTVATIAGYSFHGKSYELEAVQRHIADHHQDVVMLQCAWELEGFKSITRELSYRTKKSVREVLFQPPQGDEQALFKTTVDKYRRNGLYFQPEPVTADQFETDVMWLIQNFPTNRIVVCIDNLENILVDQGSQKECMDRMLYKINVLKKRHPFISFVILNQLNDDIITRIDNMKRHAPVSKDLYSTKQLYKLSDVVLVKVMPSKFGIQDKYMAFGKKMYPHLEEFKIPSKTKTTSFDPFGTIFYFYLKARETTNDWPTVYAKRIYTRAQMGIPEVTVEEDVPKFDSKKKDSGPPKDSIPIIHNTPAIIAAKGEEFDETKGADDEPF